MANDPIVSVFVTCYNHEKYLDRCMEGILSQKTDYPFEVIINDDASTDSSPEIIRTYEKKHPGMIKAILQTENQYSKGVPIIKSMIPYAKGRYVAICESDDYWTDVNKLQIQTEFMLNNPGYTMCCHSATVYSEREDKYYEQAVRPFECDRDISAEEIIAAGGGYIATASAMFEKKYGWNRPNYCINYEVTDYPMMIYLASNGKVRYIDRCMSVYRFQVPGSWSAAMKNIEKKEKHIGQINEMLREADEFHQGKYHVSFEKRIARNNFELAYLKQDWDEMLKKKYSAIFRETLGESQAKLRFKMKLRKLLGKK